MIKYTKKIKFISYFYMCDFMYEKVVIAKDNNDEYIVFHIDSKHIINWDGCPKDKYIICNFNHYKNSPLPEFISYRDE